MPPRRPETDLRGGGAGVPAPARGGPAHAAHPAGGRRPPARSSPRPRRARSASIERLGPITLGELAAVEQVQPPSMTRIVARLEECGYVTRVVDPTDRRVARAVITDAGATLLARQPHPQGRLPRRDVSPSSPTPNARCSRGTAAARTAPGRHAMKSLRGTFQSMHVRNFRLFFTGQLISQGGTWMQTIALNWLVLHLSHNNGFLVGLAIALQFLPTLLFGVWGGAIADRFDKRKVLLCTQVAMAAVAVVLTRPRRHRRRPALDALRARVRVRHGAGGRQPDAPVVRLRAGAAGRPAERDRAEQRASSSSRGCRARAGRRADPRRRYRHLLRAQRGVVRASSSLRC